MQTHIDYSAINIWVLNIMLATLIFFIDLQLPMGVAASIPYIGVIMLSLWLPNIRYTLFFACLCSLLTVLDFIITIPETINIISHQFTLDNDITKALLNRTTSVIAIWFTTVLAVYRKSSAIRLKYSEVKQRAVLYASIDPIIAFNSDGIIESASVSIEQVFGWKPEDIINRNINNLLNAEHSKFLLEYIHRMAEDHNCEFSDSQQEVVALHVNGNEFPCEITMSKVYIPELDHTIFTAILRDISSRKESEQRLLWLSTHDELTKIYNRRYFNQQINIEWKRLFRDRSPLAVILIDIDYFKKYNDTLGHQAGDKCLITVSNSIPNELHRAGDFVARFGGEEFVVLLPNTDSNGVETVAKNIQQLISDLNIPHPYSDVSDRITVSMGLSSMHPTKSCTQDVLIRQADHALYQAKKQGRNQFILFKSER